MSYQQFFKKAQDVKRGDDGPRKSPAQPGGAKPQFKVKRPRTEAETEKMLRRAIGGQPKRERKPLPLKAVGGLVFCMVLAGAYVLTPETFERLADKIEINAIGGASAAEKESTKDAKGAAEKSGAGSTKSEKAAATSAKDGKAKGLEEKESVTEDLSHFEKLKQRKDELDAREKELNELEEELQRQKVELDKRIVQLEDMRNSIAQILKDRVDVDQEKVNKLVDLYSNMKPKQAADVIGSINEELAVEVLAKMKKKNAAEIMNLLSPEKARVLSEKYTGYRRNHPAADNKG